MMRALAVHAYDPRWPVWFGWLRGRLATSVDGLGAVIEHVGSTAVPGCAAKPVIDADIVLPGPERLPALVDRLAGLGYTHEGDLGIPGREAFRKPSPVEHHLYSVVLGSKPYLDHILLRDYLREHPDEVRRYSDLKFELVRRLGTDDAARQAYPAAKAPLVEELLARAYAASCSTPANRP